MGIPWFSLNLLACLAIALILPTLVPSIVKSLTKTMQNQVSTDRFVGAKDYESKLGEITTESIVDLASDVLARVQVKLEFTAAVTNNDSIYAGALGLAWLYLRLYTSNTRLKIKTGASLNDATSQPLTITSDQLLAGAINIIHTQKALYHDSKSHIGFLTSAPGYHALAVVAHYLNGSKETADSHLEKLLSYHQIAISSTVSSELLYGRVGYIYALDYVHTNTNNTLIPNIHNLVKEVIDQILIDGQQDPLGDWPAVWLWHGTSYLGSAHGVAGILTTLLYHHKLLDAKQKDIVRKVFEKLLVKSSHQGTGALAIESEAARFPSGNWKSSLESSKDHLVQWCHGAPGMVPLLAAARAIYPDIVSSIDQALEEAVQVISARGVLRKGVGLCHGLSGNGYSLLIAYKATNNARYLKGAEKFVQIIEAWNRDKTFRDTKFTTPDHPYSLFEGEAGVVAFLVDYVNINGFVGFPCQTDLA